MKKAKDRQAAIRHANFHILLRRAKLQNPSRGVQRRYAEWVGIEENFLSQVKNGRKALGDDHVEAIETKEALPNGWMDIPHDTHADVELTAFLQKATAAFQTADNTTRQALNALLNLVLKSKLNPPKEGP